MMWEAEQSTGEISSHSLNFAVNLKKLQKSEVKKKNRKEAKRFKKGNYTFLFQNLSYFITL